MNAAFGDVFNDGRLSIYKTNISEPGVLVQANDLWVPKKQREAGERWQHRHSRISRRAWASISAAGAGARSSAISTTTARSICIWSTATSRRASAAATGTTSRRSPSGTAPSSATRRTGRR